MVPLSCLSVPRFVIAQLGFCTDRLDLTVAVVAEQSHPFSSPRSFRPTLTGLAVAAMSSSPLPRDGCFWLLNARLLERITQGWQREAGSGSFGQVYRGRMPEEYGGAPVAVIWLKNQSAAGKLSADARQEISISRILSSRSAMPGYDNLVRLLGYCSQPQALVYEWVGRGTLRALLHDRKRLSELTLRDRLMIFKGLASGLSVMHHGGDEEIRHKDVKPDNAMLD